MSPRPEIVLGPPGTGKTTALLQIVDEELGRGVAPDRIGYVTFTRRGAEEAVNRACEKFRLDKKQVPYFRTLHSLCFRQLGLKRGDVLEGRKLQEFADYAGVRISGRLAEDGTLEGFDKGDRILFMENLARVRGVPLREAYDADDDRLPWVEVEHTSRALLRFKQEHGLLDYTDMLAEFVRSGIRVNLEVLLVDEAQDLSALQWDVVRVLASTCRRVVIAGDDDQAIYRWAGADSDHLVDMDGDVRVLGQSWRVPPRVQDVANDVISRVLHRREKRWEARKDIQGEVEHFATFGGVDCGSGEVLVLVRNNYLLREQVEPELRRQGIVYEVRGMPSIDPAMMEAIHDWEALRAGRIVPAGAARRVYELMTPGLGYLLGSKGLPGMDDDRDVTLGDLRAQGGLLTDAIWHEALDLLPRSEIAYILAARSRGERLRRRPRVRLSTIHASKGGEADHVVLLKEMARRTYAEMMRDSDDDERRVWYVAATRAKERLSIVDSSTKQVFAWI